MDGISLYDNHIGYTEVEIAEDIIGDDEDLLGHHQVEISDPIAVELPLETVETTIVSGFHHDISPPCDGRIHFRWIDALRSFTARMLLKFVDISIICLFHLCYS